MLKIVTALVACLAAGAALAQDAAAADKSAATSETAGEPLLGIKVVEDSPAARKEEFKPPQGFVTRKRGQLVMYCKKDATVGTRFKSEQCYTEDQVRDYMLTQAENKRNIDRIRSTCANAAVCSNN